MSVLCLIVQANSVRHFRLILDRFISETENRNQKLLCRVCTDDRRPTAGSLAPTGDRPLANGFFEIAQRWMSSKSGGSD